jgi:hypothetical protein
MSTKKIVDSVNKNSVSKKLKELATRVPGRVVVPDSGEKRTLIACQLVKILDDTILIQFGSNTYELSINEIEEIQDSKNDIASDRKLGVDVVIAIRSKSIIKTTVSNIVPKEEEVPFFLKRKPLDWQIGSKDCGILLARTERWLKLNELVYELDNNQSLQCTLSNVCTTWTRGGCSPTPVCDASEGKSCESY